MANWNSWSPSSKNVVVTKSHFPQVDNPALDPDSPKEIYSHADLTFSINSSNQVQCAVNASNTYINIIDINGDYTTVWYNDAEYVSYGGYDFNHTDITDESSSCTIDVYGVVNGHYSTASTITFTRSKIEDEVEDDYNGSSTAYDLPYTDSGLIIEDNYNNTFNIKVKRYWTHSNGTEHSLLTSSEKDYKLSTDTYGYMRFKYGFELNVDYDKFTHSYGCIKNPIYFDNDDEESANNFTFYFDDDGVEWVQATGSLANKVNKSSETTEIETFATAHWEYTNYNNQTPRAVAKAKIKHYVPPKWSGEEEELTLLVTSENSKFSTRKPWTVTWKNNAVGENDISPVKGYAFALHRYNQSSSSSSLEEQLGERLPFNATVKNADKILNGEVSNNIYYVEIGDLEQGAECSIEFIPAECRVNNKDDIIIFAWPYTKYGLNNDEYFYNNNLVEENENIYFIQSSIYTAKSTGIVRVKVPNAVGGTHWKEGQVFVKTPTGWKESEGIYVKTTEGWKESQ